MLLLMVIGAYLLIGAIIAGVLGRVFGFGEEVILIIILWGILIPLLLIMYPLVMIARLISGDL